MRANDNNVVFSFRQIICFGFIFISFSACKKDGVTKPQLVDVKAGILADLNALRSRGCDCGTDTIKPVTQVKWNDSLANAAAAHAMDMYNKKYFAHVSPQGITPDEWAAQQGYNAVSLGEDIAENYNSVSATISAWQQSPEHCTVMMDSVYREVGAARYGNYWVMLMGRR